MESLSPSYQMKLISEIETVLWAQFESYRKVLLYIQKWHKHNGEYNLNYRWENFEIVTKKNGDIQLLETLHNIDAETLIKIAIDLGLETPDIIPSVPIFRNLIKAEYPTASQTFEKAFKEIEEHPDIAVGLANSALESIIKEILNDTRITASFKQGHTLAQLVKAILTEFKLFPNADMPDDIRTLASSLVAATNAIESLRSNVTNFHGKSSDDYLISDSMYTYFIVNSVVTVGMLLDSLYKRKMPPFPDVNVEEEYDDDLPF